MITIIKEDIVKAESLFLPKDEKFSGEKLEIIKCMESKDIIACPGSGKTTTLLAKLSIISNHFPFLNNQGVCVLTHTNVAIDEIKERLGKESNKLFEYPNFFGTIQSFVNHFLAIPYFQNTYRKNVASIDDDIYNKELIREFYSLSYELRFALEQKYGTRDRVVEALVNMRFSVEDDLLIDRNTGKSLFKKEGKTSQALSGIKKKIMKKGILCYEDAYWLAYKYLEKCEVQLQNFLSERFSFLFIDEMQDTSGVQCELLNRLFNKNKVIIQRFGDPNQSIYDNSGNMGWDLWDEPLKITDSKRNSSIISQMISPFEIVRSGMNGNKDIELINPKMIIFEEKDITNVLSRFAELIIENHLHMNPKNVFKAVGRIAKRNEDGKINIPSYYPDYNSKVNSEKSKKYLSDFLIREKIDPLNNKDARSYRDAIINAFLRVLWILKIKNDSDNYFTKKNLMEKIQSENHLLFSEFEENIFIWCMKMKKEEDIKQDFISQSNNILDKVFNVKNVLILTNFYEGMESKAEKLVQSPNIFNHNIDEENNVEIHINTVAGVKGETHTATLFLETFFYKYDVNNLVEAFKGKNKKSKRGVRELSASKHVYVAMSRPTHLLCVAAQKSSIIGHEKELRSAGWELVEV